MSVTLILFGVLLFAGAVFGLMPTTSYRWRAAVLCGCAALLLWSMALGLFYLNRGTATIGQDFLGDPARVAADFGNGLTCLARGSLVLPPVLLMTAVSFFVRKIKK